MKIYITGLPSGYEVEHLARLFYPMAPLTLTPPEPAEDCLWAEKTDTGLRVLVRQGEKSKTLEAPLPLPVEQGGETPEFALASLTYDLLRQWTGIRPPWGKMTGVRPVRLIHDKRAAGWSAEKIDRFFLQRFDCSEQKYEMAKEISDLQEPILRLGSAPKTYSLYIGICGLPVQRGCRDPGAGRACRADLVQHLHRRRHAHQPFCRPAAAAHGHRAGEF